MLSKFHKLVLGCVIGTVVSAAPVLSASVTYGGITFPDGDISFADRVVGTVASTLTNGIPTNQDFLDPNNTLGAPDYAGDPDNPGDSTFSLGAGGSITLQFVNNALTGSGSSLRDLHIFEIGADVEDTFVHISQTGTTWLDVGKVGGGTSSIDIDPFLTAANLASDTKFFFVRLRDDPAEGQTANGPSGTVGADIDAVGAISTVAVSPVPLPASLPLIFVGCGALCVLRRRRNAPH